MRSLRTAVFPAWPVGAGSTRPATLPATFRAGSTPTELVVGDAYVTTKQDSAHAVATQIAELHRPPMYVTRDWTAARMSVERLAALEPELVITKHGDAMSGTAMRDALRTLARDFDDLAVPDHGRYVNSRARAGESGATHVPPAS